jgi:hypothetical protein
LEELEQIAAHHNIRISSANLKKYAYCIQSGMCRVRGEYRIILDKHLHLSEKIDVLIDALQSFDIDPVSMNPVLQKIFKKKALSAEPLPEETVAVSAGG